jgi:hypothetical protein
VCEWSIAAPRQGRAFDGRGENTVTNVRTFMSGEDVLPTGRLQPRRRATTRHGIDRSLTWPVALLLGATLGLGLRLLLFCAATFAVRAIADVGEGLLQLLPTADPVYSHVAMRSLGDVHIQGLAIGGPLGTHLHALFPSLIVDPARAHFAMVRLTVEPGSALIARLAAAGLAHAALLGVGLWLVRAALLTHNTARLLIGIAVQAQVAIGILGAPPSARELESTGVSFAANALMPWLWQRGQALTDVLATVPPSILTASLVGLALGVAYLPAGLLVLLKTRARALTLCSALAITLCSAACAGVLEPDGIAPASVVAELHATSTTQTPQDLPALFIALPRAARVMPATPVFDRWFDSPASSRVEVRGAAGQYRLLVNGGPQVIKGMGLNTQYSHLMTPDERAARLESDMAAYQQLGVNTVLGWDPAEFDSVLLDAAERHGIGVVMPFDLDPDADYTDPSVRQRLHVAVLAWVERYKDAPSLRMWGLGNEVLHKIVHPAWVGPQDPARERNAEAFSDWLVETADAIHAADPNHPVTYRSAEDAFVDWVAAAFERRGGGPRPWFVWGTNCYQDYLSRIVDNWPSSGMDTALWVSEFAPGTMAVPDRPDGFRQMWADIRRHPDWVLGGAIYAWTRNGPEGVDRNFGLTDDGTPVDGRSLDAIAELFHQD